MQQPAVFIEVVDGCVEHVTGSSIKIKFSLCLFNSFWRDIFLPGVCSGESRKKSHTRKLHVLTLEMGPGNPLSLRFLGSQTWWDWN